VYILPVNAALVASPLLAAAVFGGLMIWTVRYARASEQLALARRARETAVSV
jgi:hypothetical protein